MHQIPYRKAIAKASLTVEATCCIFLILFTIMGTIYLCFFVHNRSWLTAAAYESAVVGSMQTDKDSGKCGNVAKERAVSLGNTGFYGGNHLQCQVNSGKTIEVSYTMDTNVEFGRLLWKLQVKGKAKLLRPIDWIRKTKITTEVLKGGKG